MNLCRNVGLQPLERASWVFFKCIWIFFNQIDGTRFKLRQREKIGLVTQTEDALTAKALELPARVPIWCWYGVGYNINQSQNALEMCQITLRTSGKNGWKWLKLVIAKSAKYRVTSTSKFNFAVEWKNPLTRGGKLIWRRGGHRGVPTRVTFLLHRAGSDH